jgi:hypothetical protein
MTQVSVSHLRQHLPAYLKQLGASWRWEARWPLAIP